MLTAAFFDHHNANVDGFFLILRELYYISWQNKGMHFMEPVKIAILTRPAEGGMKKHILQLLKYINRDFFSVYFIGPSQLVQSLEDRFAATFYLEIGEHLSPFRKTQEVLKLASYLHNTRIKILHCHGVQAGLVGRLAAAITDTPLVICTFHNLIYDRPYTPWQKQIFAWGNRLLNHKTSRFIAVSQAIKRQLIEQENIPPEKIDVIYNGLEIEDFTDYRSIDKLSLPSDRPIVGMIGRLIEEKGADLFLECASRINRVKPNAEFWIAGHGPQRPLLEHKAQALGIANNTKFFGFHKDIAQFLDETDVVVVPSRTEGLSIVTLEAMARAKPVVAFQVGALPELIIPGQTGILIPAFDTNLMAQAVIRILNDTAYASYLGLNGYTRVIEEFTVQRMIQATESVYLKALTNHEKGRTNFLAASH